MTKTVNYDAHWSRTNIDQDKWNRFIEDHPHLAELSMFDAKELNTNAAITLVSQLNSLKTIRLDGRIANEDEDKEFLGQLANDWICDCSYDKDVGRHVRTLRRK